jgi:UDP-GlcNAc:undecaprenyl-phosphate/decaprenyl-phosphate GlcNAc-1-phosphate transferase
VNYTALISVSTLFFLVSTLFVYLSARSPLARYFLDEPDKRKMHTIQIPRIGGFAIILSYAAVLSLLAVVSPTLLDLVLLNDTGKAIGFAALLVFILGFFDDSTFVELTVAIKFGVQFVIALGVVYVFGISFEELYIFDHVLYLGEIGRALTVLWIVGVTNALNIIDGIDGLSASVTITSLAIAAVVLFISGNSEILFVVLPLIAIILGFLVHNYPPAKLFAGDTGSLFFGSLVAILSVKVAALGQERGVESLSAFYIAAFPVIEVWVSMLRRFVYGQRSSKNLKDSLKRMVTPDNLHMHHRLIFKGYTHEQALRFLVFFAISISSIAIILVLTSNSLYKSIAIIYSVFFLIMVLRRLDYGKQDYFSEQSSETVRRVIAITGESDYFEHSLRHFVRNKYWIARFERISDVMGRRVDAYIVYNESDDCIETDIMRALDIRSSSERPLFFITNIDKNSIPQLRDKQVYFMKKPVDMPYLMHDIKKIIAAGGSVSASDINSTLTIEGEHVTES